MRELTKITLKVLEAIKDLYRYFSSSSISTNTNITQVGGDNVPQVESVGTLPVVPLNSFGNNLYIDELMDYNHYTAFSYGSMKLDTISKPIESISSVTYNHLSMGMRLGITSGSPTELNIQVVGIMESGDEYILDPQEWALRNTRLSSNQDYRTITDLTSNYLLEVNTNNILKVVKIYGWTDTGEVSVNYEYALSANNS